MPAPFQPHGNPKSHRLHMIPQKEYKRGGYWAWFFSCWFESPRDVQSGPEHLLFLAWPPTHWQYRVSIIAAYVSSHSELATAQLGLPEKDWHSKAELTKPKHSRLSKCPKPSYKQQVSSPREKSCLKMWTYTHRTPMWNQTWFLLLSYLVFVQEMCQRVSQNLNNISFTSNNIKYLELTAISTVLIIVLKMEDI